jgi:hypothetical protein
MAGAVDKIVTDDSRSKPRFALSGCAETLTKQTIGCLDGTGARLGSIPASLVHSSQVAVASLKLAFHRTSNPPVSSKSKVTLTSLGALRFCASMKTAKARLLLVMTARIGGRLHCNPILTVPTAQSTSELGRRHFEALSVRIPSPQGMLIRVERMMAFLFEHVSFIANVPTCVPPTIFHHEANYKSEL